MTLQHLHVARRIQHAVTGLFLIAISHIIPPYPVGCLLLLLATTAFYYIHKKRVHDPKWDDWYLQRFGSLLRNHERGEWEEDKQRRKSIPALPGAFYFLLGAALSTVLFPANVARTSVLILTISDPIAGLVGSWFTWKGFNIAWKQLLPTTSNASTEGPSIASPGCGPSVVGSFAFALSTILCTYVYIPASKSAKSTTLCFYSRLCIGIVAAMAEAVGGRHLPFVVKTADDNLLIPLVVGCLASWLDASE